MRVRLIYGCLFLLSCGPGPAKETAVVTRPADTVAARTTVNSTADTSLSFAKTETPTQEPPVAPPVKRPSGVYRFILPLENGHRVLHTITFSAGTFRLQEEYFQEGDSIVVTEGTWAPSAGYIWLYRGQVVRGRYTWKGDTLEYYSPRLKETFSMEKLAPVLSTAVWQAKKQDGAVLYAIGNEPFWSLEVTAGDTIVLNMPDWSAPLRAKMTAAEAAEDSTVFTASNDSLHLTVYPLFCNDGMSDFHYTKKVKLVYKGQTYQGCAERFRAP